MTLQIKGAADDPLTLWCIACAITCHNPTARVIAHDFKMTEQTAIKTMLGEPMASYKAAAAYQLERMLGDNGPQACEPEPQSQQAIFETMVMQLGMSRGMLAIGESDPRQYAHPILNGMWRWHIFHSQPKNKEEWPIAIFEGENQIQWVVKNYLDRSDIHCQLRGKGQTHTGSIFAYLC